MLSRVLNPLLQNCASGRYFHSGSHIWQFCTSWIAIICTVFYATYLHISDCLAMIVLTSTYMNLAWFHITMIINSMRLVNKSALLLFTIYLVHQSYIYHSACTLHPQFYTHMLCYISILCTMISMCNPASFLEMPGIAVMVMSCFFKFIIWPSHRIRKLGNSTIKSTAKNQHSSSICGHFLADTYLNQKLFNYGLSRQKNHWK